jgi:hypothetical protein|nr:MAG TPA: hypothetical protein [Bacteriophage sp.]
MSGAVSFVLGLLGFGAAGGINLGQSVSQKKKEAELAEMYGWDADAETKKMRKRVEEEWRQIASWNHNCLGECWYIPGNHMSTAMMRKRWFRRHLEAKGIPYDDVVLDKVTGVTADKIRKQMLREVANR